MLRVVRRLESWETQSKMQWVGEYRYLFLFIVWDFFLQRLLKSWIGFESISSAESVSFQCLLKWELGVRMRWETWLMCRLGDGIKPSNDFRFSISFLLCWQAQLGETDHYTDWQVDDSKLISMYVSSLRNNPHYLISDDKTDLHTNPHPIFYRFDPCVPSF